jgi:serine/threonine-protein kinase
MPLTAGTRLGSFEVLAAIGAGGMGEVYQARDTKLNRDVALKILPDAFTVDGDRIARFRREAQVLASLNHPNIAHIYGFEDSGSTHALVLELVEGPTLGDRIAKGPIPLDEALPIAKQIAEALEAAHEQGIVHRDLKPANIKVMPDGKVKVLDFGLAKLIETPRPVHAAAFSQSPTITTPAMMTGVGIVLGTAAYMSPEQARGKPIDRRADIWAFGCVLFEMLTGRQTFDAGETVSDAVAAILRTEPEWSSLPANTPQHIVRLLRRCLQKDSLKRLPHIGLARVEIDEGAATNTATAVLPTEAVKASRTRVAVIAAVALAAGGVLTAVIAILMRPASVPMKVVRFAIVPPAATPVKPGGGDVNLAISPDGTQMAYSSGVAGGAEGPLVYRALDRLEVTAIPGVVGRRPFFSPDGKWVAFFNGGELKKVQIGGGPAIPVCQITGQGRGGTWGSDNTIVFATSDQATGLMAVPAGGGNPQPLTKPDVERGERDHYEPSFLPSARAVLFEITAGSPDDAQIAVLDRTTNQVKRLLRGGNASYVDPGYLVYSAAGTLRAVRFDAKRLEVVGDPVPVLNQVNLAGGGASQYAVSRTGTLVYQAGTPGQTGPPRTLVWMDRQGHEEPIPAPPHAYTVARLSPDGGRIALDIRERLGDIFVWDVRRQILQQLTFDPAADEFPLWTLDGRYIVFASNRTGIMNLFRRAADGSGSDERLTNINQYELPSSFSPDGKSLVVTEQRSTTGLYLERLADPGGKSVSAVQSKVQTLLQTEFTTFGGEVSPDGHWLAYSANNSGQPQVYVRSFPNTEAGLWQITAAGGSRPAWARSGKELFYLGANGSMMVMPVQTTPVFSFGNPTKLFEGPWYAGVPGRTYDVAADGQRFLMIKEAINTDPAAAQSMLYVVVNWTEELKQRLPQSP